VPAIDRARPPRTARVPFRLCETPGRLVAKQGQRVRRGARSRLADRAGRRAPAFHHRSQDGEGSRSRYPVVSTAARADEIIE